MTGLFVQAPNEAYLDLEERKVFTPQKLYPATISFIDGDDIQLRFKSDNNKDYILRLDKSKNYYWTLHPTWVLKYWRRFGHFPSEKIIQQLDLAYS